MQILGKNVQLAKTQSTRRHTQTDRDNHYSIKNHYYDEYNLTYLTFVIHILRIYCNAADIGVMLMSVFSVMGAFGHDSAFLYFHPDQQAFLGAREHCWVKDVSWD